MKMINISYNFDGIRVETKDLGDFLCESELPIQVQFVQSVTKKILWSIDIGSNSWVSFPNQEMINVIVNDNIGNKITEYYWDIVEHGNYIYKKLWFTLNRNYNIGKPNHGVVVGTHNGEFGEWVPVAIDELSDIILVEASDKQYNELVENYSSYNNLKFINQLVTKDGGETIFYEGGKGYTNTVLKRVIDYWETEPITETVRESIKFSELITPDVNWIHTDVEGIDFELIMSLTDEQLSHLDIIIYEYNNSSDNERELINNFLIEKGFQTYREKGVSIAFKK